MIEDESTPKEGLAGQTGAEDARDNRILFERILIINDLKDSALDLATKLNNFFDKDVGTVEELRNSYNSLKEKFDQLKKGWDILENNLIIMLEDGRDNDLFKKLTQEKSDFVKNNNMVIPSDFKVESALATDKLDESALRLAENYGGYLDGKKNAAELIGVYLHFKDELNKFENNLTQKINSALINFEK